MTTLDFREFQVLSLFSAWKKKKHFDVSVSSLFGDASGREYFRVQNGDETVVVMKVAHAPSPEFGRGDSFSDFIATQGMLAQTGIRVPEILYRDDESRMLILEDLGDLTMYSFLQLDPSSKMQTYCNALSLLILWQKRMNERTLFTSPGDKRLFSSKLFMDEFYHFHEYMIEKRIYYPSWRHVWEKSSKIFRKISSELSKSPYGLAHRDFQSKNIMILPSGQYVLIDFQDTLQAPLVYDLVALLRDSYITLDGKELDFLLDYYWNRVPFLHDIYGGKPAFLRLFHLQTVQRKMKDAGRFIYLHQVKGKEWFLSFVHPSLLYVRHALSELEMNDLLDIYGAFIPEFGEALS